MNDHNLQLWIFAPKIQYLIRIRFFKIWTTLVRPVWSLRSKAHLVNPGARGAHLEFFCPLLPTFLRDSDKLPFHNLRFSFTHLWTKPFLVLLCYCHCKNLLTFLYLSFLYTFFCFRVKLVINGSKKSVIFVKSGHPTTKIQCTLIQNLFFCWNIFFPVF